MARARNLKPSFFTNEELATLSPFARLLFAGLWCHADRDGRLEDRPLRLKVSILPYDDQSVDQLLTDLQRGNFLVRYEADGKKYIQINTFKKHQNPHKQEQPSVIPPFTGLLPNNFGSSHEVARPLSVDLNPQPLTLNPILPDYKNEEVLRRLEPKTQPEAKKPYAIPFPEEKPADSLVLFYKVLQGAPYDFRPWDKAWGRWKLKAQELLQIFGGHYSAAYQCLKTKGEELTIANRTWNFNTIVDQAHLWRQQHGGEEYALVNRERFLRDVIEQRRQKKIEGLRKVSTPGEVLDPERNRGALTSGNPKGEEQTQRSGEDRNGRSLESVQPGNLEGEKTPNGASPTENGNGIHGKNGRGSGGSGDRVRDESVDTEPAFDDADAVPWPDG